MNDELPQDDALQHAIGALRATVPITPGLAERIATTRRRHAQRSRMTRATVIAALLIVGIIALRPFTGSGAAVTFALEAPQVRSVSLVGDFTDWQPGRVQLTQSHNGTWEVTLRLQPGRYRFAYVVNDREWRSDGRAAAVKDDFGRPTSILTVASK